MIQRLLLHLKLKSIKYNLLYDIASGSELTSCIKIDKPLVVYRFWERFDVHNNIAYIMTK